MQVLSKETQHQQAVAEAAHDESRGFYHERRSDAGAGGFRHANPVEAEIKRNVIRAWMEERGARAARAARTAEEPKREIKSPWR